MVMRQNRGGVRTRVARGAAPFAWSHSWLGRFPSLALSLSFSRALALFLSLEHSCLQAKPFACECGKRFTSADALNVQVAIRCFASSLPIVSCASDEAHERSCGKTEAECEREWRKARRRLRAWSQRWLGRLLSLFLSLSHSHVFRANHLHASNSGKGSPRRTG